MTTYYKLMLAADESSSWISGDYPLHLILKPDNGGTSLNAYWIDLSDPTNPQEHGVEWVEVHYSGERTDDFVMKGATAQTPGGPPAEPPEISEVLVEANFRSRCWWTITGTSITWTFKGPTKDLDYAIWEFNNSGNGPPVKVKVVLKRQDVVVTP